MYRNASLHACKARCAPPSCVGVRVYKYGARPRGLLSYLKCAFRCSAVPETLAVAARERNTDALQHRTIYN